MALNIARYDLVSIRLAVLCADFGSLSAAAKTANCSLSSGSQRISALEELMGTPLFIRHYRGLQPTQAGELFVSRAKSILEHIECLEKDVARCSADCTLSCPAGLLAS